MRSPRIATILVLASCAALAACERERERAPTANDAQVAAAPAQAPATAAIRAGTGDFTVQLAAPGSEAEARDFVSTLQKRLRAPHPLPWRGNPEVRTGS